MTEAVTRLSGALSGSYRIDRELGAGGMATVYLAENLRHHRQVTLKVIRWDIHPDGKKFLYIEGGGGGSTKVNWILNWTELVKSKTVPRP